MQRLETLAHVTVSFFFLSFVLPRGHIYLFIYNLYKYIDTYMHTHTQARHVGAGSGLKLLVNETSSY